MNISLEKRLGATKYSHKHLIGSMAYMFATEEARLLDAYVLLHIRDCPRFLPKFIYHWILKHVLVLDRFLITNAYEHNYSVECNVDGLDAM